MNRNAIPLGHILASDVIVGLLLQYAPALAWLHTLGEDEILRPGSVVVEAAQGCGNKTQRA